MPTESLTYRQPLNRTEDVFSLRPSQSTVNLQTKNYTPRSNNEISGLRHQDTSGYGKTPLKSERLNLYEDDSATGQKSFYEDRKSSYQPHSAMKSNRGDRSLNAVSKEELARIRELISDIPDEAFSSLSSR